MGKKNKKAAVEPVKFIEADPGEVQEEEHSGQKQTILFNMMAVYGM